MLRMWKNKLLSELDIRTSIEPIIIIIISTMTSFMHQLSEFITPTRHQILFQIISFRKLRLIRCLFYLFIPKNNYVTIIEEIRCRLRRCRQQILTLHSNRRRNVEFYKLWEYIGRDVYDWNQIFKSKFFIKPTGLVRDLNPGPLAP